MRDQRGASAVEFALIVPIVILLLIGTVTTALVYSDHLAVTNAVREGARYGSAANILDSGWATSVRDRVKQVYFNANGVQPSDNEVCVKLVDSSGSQVASVASWTGSSCGSAPAVPSSMTPGSCAVLVWMQQPETIQLAVFPSLHPTIGGEAVAYFQQSVTNTPCTAN